MAGAAATALFVAPPFVPDRRRAANVLVVQRGAGGNRAAEGGAEGTEPHVQIRRSGPKRRGERPPAAAGRRSRALPPAEERPVLPPFSGPPGVGGIGPQGPLFGNGGNATRIAFVCDASASMADKMPALKEELSRAIMNLKPIQSFSVIFLREKECDAFSKKLTPGVKANKADALKFVDGIKPAGRADPLPGLRAAFENNPQLVYLLIDAGFADNGAVRDEVAKLNDRHKVKVNTVLFTSSKEPPAKVVETLKKIAEENGGTYRLVRPDELGK